MPLTSQVHVNAPLTDVSTAYIQDAGNYIADQVFPIVRVQKKSDLYFIYNKNDYFRDEAQVRAPGAESAGGDYDLSTGTYTTKTWAFHKDISDEERENSDPALDPDADAAEYVTQKVLIKRERQFMTDYFATGKWGTEVEGTEDFTKWSDYAGSDPIADIETGKTTILQNTGYEANRLVLSYNAFEKLKNHPLIVDRYKHTSADSITADMMARVFDVEKVIVAKTMYATNEEGATAAMSFTSGKHALLVYAAPTPSLKKPSGGYIFTFVGENRGEFGNAIRNYDLRGSGRLVDRIEGDLRFDTKLVGSDLGYFFLNAVA